VIVQPTEIQTALHALRLAETMVYAAHRMRSTPATKADVVLGVDLEKELGIDWPAVRRAERDLDALVKAHGSDAEADAALGFTLGHIAGQLAAAKAEVAPFRKASA
jgi:hypothetical protein